MPNLKIKPEKTEKESSLAHPLGPLGKEPRWPLFFAIGMTLFLHLGVYIILPEQMFQFKKLDKTTGDEPIEVTLLDPPPELEPQYVEANPDAAENKPDETNQYSFRDQQAADENSDDSLLEAPNVEGEEDSMKIVQGSVASPPSVEAVQAPQTQKGEGEGTEGGKAGVQSEQVTAESEPLPPPDFLKQEAVEEEGLGSGLEPPGEALEVAQEIIPETPINVYRPPTNTEVPQNEPGDGQGGSPQVTENAKPVPRERPRLNPELVQGPLINSRGSASRRGTLAIDSTFSEFGEYEQQFYAALQAGWYQEIEFFQPIDTSSRVIIRFTIKSDGSIHDMEVVFTNASEIATVICETAVTKRSPFRPWTKEMVRVMGTEKSIAVRFHYR